MATIPGVSDNELIRTSWGNLVATELNSFTVKNNVASQSIDGPLFIVSGSGLAAVRMRAATPLFTFESTGGTEYGRILANTTEMQFSLPTGSFFRWAVNAVELARLEPAGGGFLTLGGGVRALGGSWARDDDGAQLALIDTAGNAVTGHAWIAFYPNGTSHTVPGTRGAAVGFNGAGFAIEATDDIIFQLGAAEIARTSGTRFLFGKAATAIGNTGIELSGNDGALNGTVSTNIPNFILNRTSAAIANGGIWISFRNNNAANGSITWNTATSQTNFNQTSDYRLKNDLGPVTDGLERVRLLNPRRITRKDSPAPLEHDALFAHEVAEVVPAAVTGTKDAVAPAPPAGEPPENYPVEGSIIPQQLDYSGLVTVLIAAVKELADSVDALSTRITALEGGAT